MGGSSRSSSATKVTPRTFGARRCRSRETSLASLTRRWLKHKRTTCPLKLPGSAKAGRYGWFFFGEAAHHRRHPTTRGRSVKAVFASSRGAARRGLRPRLRSSVQQPRQRHTAPPIANRRRERAARLPAAPDVLGASGIANSSAADSVGPFDPAGIVGDDDRSVPNSDPGAGGERLAASTSFAVSSAGSGRAPAANHPNVNDPGYAARPRCPVAGRRAAALALISVTALDLSHAARPPRDILNLS